MSRTPPPIHVFFPIKIDFVLFGKNLHKILRFCTDLHTNVLPFRWKDQLHFLYYKWITSKYSVSDTVQQHFSVFLFLQNCISSRKDIQQQQNVPSKGLFLQHFKISKWLPFFIVCRKIHNRKLVVDKKNPPLPPIQKAATSFKY